MVAITVANGKDAVLAALEKFRQDDQLTRANCADFIERMDANTGMVIQLLHGTIEHPGDLLKDAVILMNEGAILHQVQIGDFYRKVERPQKPDPEWASKDSWDRKFKE